MTFYKITDLICQFRSKTIKETPSFKFSCIICKDDTARA